MGRQPSLPWLDPGGVLPAADTAWDRDSDAPGLLAAGGDLSVQSLLRAYASGAFPWFSQGQPILWWCPDPRMVLELRNLRLHRSLRQTLRRFRNSPACELRMDTRFDRVIDDCARSPRPGQDGTWILPEMVQAYQALHRSGVAHSVETWIDGRLVGGLYCVVVGQAVFGESMFSTRADASKIALAALACFCLQHGIEWIDCQQNTAHLAGFGAREVARERFLAMLARASARPAPQWQFDALYWNHLLPSRPDLT